MMHGQKNIKSYVDVCKINMLQHFLRLQKSNALSPLDRSTFSTHTVTALTN